MLTKLIAGAALLPIVMMLALLNDGADRILHARMQRRTGPPLLQTYYDVLKLLCKETIVPRRAVAWVFNGAPWASLTVTLMLFLYLPMGALPPILGTEGDVILVLYLLATSAVCLVAGGYASGSPYASVGASREMVLMMSYEFPLSMVVCTLAWYALRTGMPGEPFSLETFVATPLWGVVGLNGLLGLGSLFLVLLAVVPAEVGKAPMDIPEAKTEILEGLIVEYSGRNLALIKIVFALRQLAMCALVVNLFLPWSLGGALGVSGLSLFALDFLAFWVKVFAVQVLAVTLVRTAFGRIKIWQASWFYWVPVGGLSLEGMLLMTLDNLKAA